MNQSNTIALYCSSVKCVATPKTGHMNYLHRDCEMILHTEFYLKKTLSLHDDYWAITYKHYMCYTWDMVSTQPCLAPETTIIHAPFLEQAKK